jgi:biopolymer transport protein ExbD
MKTADTMSRIETYLHLPNEQKCILNDKGFSLRPISGTFCDGGCLRTRSDLGVNEVTAYARKSRRKDQPTHDQCDAFNRCVAGLANYLHGGRSSEATQVLYQDSSQPDGRVLPPDIGTLVVTIKPDRTLQLNGLSDDMGTVEDSSKLNEALVSLFEQRKTNHNYRAEMLSRIDLPEDYRIEKTVFINAPRSIPYGDVAKVIDRLKGAGADPVGLRLDNLN